MAHLNDQLHAHVPAPQVAVGRQDGTAWFADGGDSAPCQTCGVALRWQRHPDRPQWGWQVRPVEIDPETRRALESLQARLDAAEVNAGLETIVHELLHDHALRRITAAEVVDQLTDAYRLARRAAGRQSCWALESAGGER